MNNLILNEAFIPMFLAVGGGIELQNKPTLYTSDDKIYYSYNNDVADLDAWFELKRNESVTIFDDVYVMHKRLEWDKVRVSYRNVQVDIGNLSNNFLDKATYDTNDNAKVETAETINGFTVEANVPAGATFTDTTYVVGDGGLTEVNFTNALKTAYDGKETGLGLPASDGYILASLGDGTRYWANPNFVGADRNFISLLDTPPNYVADKYVRVNPTGTALIYDDVASGSSDFVSLTDTPLNYTGQASKAVIVKGDESGLEFGDVSSDNVYTANGSLTGDRTVDTNGSTLTLGSSFGGVVTDGQIARLATNDTGQAIVECNQDGEVILRADNGLKLYSGVGTVGQVITSNGANQPTWADTSSDNIYTANGTITDSRNVTIGGSYLRIQKQNGNDFTQLYINSNHSQLGAIGDTYSTFVQCSPNGVCNISAEAGLSLNGVIGTSGQVLMSNGASQPTWETVPSDNVYNTNGSTTDNREIDIATRSFSILGTSVKMVLNEHNVEIGHPLKSGVGSFIKIEDSGKISITATDGIELDSTVGTAGQVLTSQGSAQPTWTTVSSGSTTLDGLTDTTISSPTDGQALTWDNASSKWINSAISGSGDMLKSVYDTNDSGVVDNSEKVNSLTVETAVPVGAVFTDTTYSVGDGELTEINFTSADNTKLDGIEASANNYTHPSGDGNLHVPANGTTNNGKVLTAGATAGVYTWETPTGGGSSSILYNTGNPATDTDPATDDTLWVNKNTGELFVCMSNAVGENVWKGQLGTTIAGLLSTTFDVFGDGSRLVLHELNGDVTDTGGTHNGTVLVAGSFVTGKFGQALSNGVVDIYPVALTGAYSVTGWVKMTATTTTNCIISTMEISNTFHLGIYVLDTGAIKFATVDGGSFTASTITLDTWVHVGAVIDGTTVRCYVDGTQVGTYTPTSGTRSQGNLIGRYYDGYTGLDMTEGVIDQVSIFNRTLTPTEIQSLANIAI